jgi:hypothetical protein
MTSTQIAVLIIVLLVIAAAVVAGRFFLRRRTLQRKFGPEYDRAVADGTNRVAAERELLDRERRHEELDIRPLEPEARERYANDWRAVQALFIEDPARAVESGDEIVTRLVGERGYPTENYSDQLSYLSVEHARTLGHYRDAHDIYLRAQRNAASTEELRQALVHYRELFADLLGDPSPTSDADDPTAHDSAVPDSPDRADSYDNAPHDTPQR